MRDKLAAQTDQRRHELEASLNAKLAAAEAQIAETRARAMSNVGAIAADAAAAIVQQLTGRPADSGTIAQAAATLDVR
jgi:F-type H+-transporting ATPase subunit b